MNLNEYKGSFLFKSPSSSSRSIIPKTAKLEMFTYLCWPIYRVSRLNFLESLVPWENTSIFLVRWDLTFKQILITKTQELKLYSVRALKQYLKETNLIHGQVMATTSKFSAQIVETYFRSCKIPLIFNWHKS